jgi:hypothetical protein
MIITKDGKWSYEEDNLLANGIAWIEDDLFCFHSQSANGKNYPLRQKDKIWFDNKKICNAGFQNPEGTLELKNEYLFLSNFKYIWPCSPVD